MNNDIKAGRGGAAITSASVLKTLLVLSMCFLFMLSVSAQLFATSETDGELPVDPGEEPSSEDTVPPDDTALPEDGSVPEDGAAPDEPEVPETPEVDNSSTDSCICGRPYYTTDGDGHRQFDCINCNVNNRSCTCDCWCGADSYTGTSATGQQVLYCSRCKKLCPDCTCAVKELALLRESEIRNGTLSVMGIAKPFNVFPSLFMLVTVSALMLLGLFSLQKTYGRELPVSVNVKPKKKPIMRPSPSPASKKTVPEAASIDIKWKQAEAYPAISLYAATMSSYTGRKASAPGISQLSGNKRFTLNEDDMSEFFLLSRLEASRSPIHPTGRVGNAEHLVSLGLAVEQPSGKQLTDKGTVFARVMFTPDETVSVATGASPSYFLCILRDYGIAVSADAGVYTVIPDIKRDYFASFIKDTLAPSCAGESRCGRFTEALSYEEWLVLLSAYAENSDTFGIRALARAEKAEFFNRVIGACRKKADFPLPEDVLDTESVIKVLSALTEKGLIQGSGGTYNFTLRGKLLSFEGLRDILFFDRHSVSGDGPEITLLALYRASSDTGDCVTAICDTGTEIRLISSSNIPWRKYIG